MKPNRNFGYYGCLFLSLFFTLLLVFIVYKSEVEYKGLAREHYINYFIPVLLGVIVFTVLLRFKETFRLNVLLLMISSAVTVYSIEVVFTIFPSLSVTSSHDERVEKEKEKINYEPRSEKEYLSDLLREGVDAVPRILPGFFTMSNGIPGHNIFPLGGISKKLTVHCNESGKMITYMSDRYGFNNLDEVWDSPSVSFITTGDSFTQGDCVEQNQTIASNLSKLTKKVGINLGMGGNGPLTELGVLNEYGERIKPKLVFWIYFEGNDLYELMAEKTSKILSSYMDNSYKQGLINKQNKIDQYLESWFKKKLPTKSERFNLKNFLFFKRLRDFIKSRYLSLDVATGHVDTAWPIFEKILLAAKSKVSSWGGRLIFVYLPSYSRYAKKNINHDLYLDKELLLTRVAALSIKTIDMHSEVFIKQDDPLIYFPFRANGHYNKDGYFSVAKRISEEMKGLVE